MARLFLVFGLLISFIFIPRSIISYGWLMSFYHVYGIGYILVTSYIVTVVNKRNISLQAVFLILTLVGVVVSIGLNWHYFAIRGDFYEYTGSDSITIQENIEKYAQYGLQGFWERTKYSWDDSAIVILGYVPYMLTESVIGFKVLNFLPYILTAYFITKVTQRKFLALLWGLNPVVLYYLSSGLKEIWFTFFIIWFIYLVKISRAKLLPLRILLGLFISGFRYPTSVFILVSATRLRMIFTVALVFSTLVLAELLPSIHYLSVMNTEVAQRNDISGATKSFLTVVNGFFGPLPTFHGGKTGYNLALWSYGLLPLPILGKKLLELSLTWNRLNGFNKMLVSFVLMSVISLILVGRVFKARYLMPYLVVWICLLPINSVKTPRRGGYVFYLITLIVIFIWNYRR